MASVEGVLHENRTRDMSRGDYGAQTYGVKIAKLNVSIIIIINNIIQLLFENLNDNQELSEILNAIGICKSP